MYLLGEIFQLEEAITCDAILTTWGEYISVLHKSLLLTDQDIEH